MGIAFLLIIASPDVHAGSEATGEVLVELAAAKEPELIVVYVEGATAAGRRHVVHQANLKFEPRLTVVGTGETVEFPNDDTVTHNVFSVSLAKKFNLGLYRQGQTKSVTFDKPGAIDVFCNIHSSMHASIIVVPSAIYGRPDKQGRLRLAGLAPGKHTLVATKKGATLARFDVVVKAKAVTSAAIRIP